LAVSSGQNSQQPKQRKRKNAPAEQVQPKRQPAWSLHVGTILITHEEVNEGRSAGIKILPGSTFGSKQGDTPVFLHGCNSSNNPGSDQPREIKHSGNCGLKRRCRVDANYFQRKTVVGTGDIQSSCFPEVERVFEQDWGLLLWAIFWEEEVPSGKSPHQLY
jgi:hypothetical protein